MAEDRDAPLRTIIPVLFVVGILALVVVYFFGDISGENFYPLAATVALLIYILTFIDIRIGIAALILAVGLSPGLAVGDVGHVRFEDFVVPPLFVSWITRVIGKREVFAPTALKGPVILYLVIALIANLVGITTGSIKNIEYSFFFLAKNIEYFIIFVIILNNIKSEQDAKALIIISVIVGLLTGLRSISSYETAERAARIMGPLGETGNIVAGYFIMQMCIILGLFLTTDNVRNRVLLGISFLFLLYVTMLTFSRTSYIALVVSLIIFGILKNRKLLIVSIIGLIFFPLIAPEGVISRASTIANIASQAQQPESWGARVSAWEKSFGDIISSPFFGGGLGFTNLGDIDNEYVRVAVDMGIGGLIVFLWLLFRIGKQVLFAYDNIIYDSTIFGYISGFFMAYIAMLIHALGATSFTTIRTMETFMILTAILMAIINGYQEWQKDKYPTPEAEGVV